MDSQKSTFSNLAAFSIAALIFVMGPAAAQVVPACDLLLVKRCTVETPNFNCKDARPIASLALVWNGPETVIATIPDGSTDVINPGDEVTFVTGGVNKREYEVQLNQLTGDAVSSISFFDLKCKDETMDGPEDCDNIVGGGKSGTGIADWIFKGMTGAGGAVVDCIPGVSCIIAGPPEEFLVTYFYEVVNRGAETISDLSVIDDKLGLVGGPVSSLAPGQVVSFERTEQITTTTTNTANAVGATSSGELCQAESQPVTVEVSM